MLLMLIGARPSSARQAAVAGGARVRSKLDEVFGGAHDYAPARPSEFPDADLGFYQAANTELTGAGYVALGDLEDLTLSRAYPMMRTFQRIYVDQGQLIRAGVYHLRTRGVLVGMLQVIRAAPRNLRLVELVTVLVVFGK